MAQSLTVRIAEPDHRLLRDLSAETGEPMQAVIHEALEQLRRKRFHDRANAAFAALRADPAAWKEELEERAVWDAALGDDLEPE